MTFKAIIDFHDLLQQIRKSQNLPIPFPKSILTDKNESLVSPSSRVQAALLVKFNRGDQTRADLARALETPWPVVERLEDHYHWSTLKLLSKTAAVLGQKLVLSFEKCGQDET